MSITVTAAMGLSLFGYNQGLMAGLIQNPKFTNSFPILEESSERTQPYVSIIEGAVTACFEIGCLFGVLFSMFFSEILGRTCLVLTGASVVTIGAVITMTAFGDKQGICQFAIGRVVSGVGNGMNTVTIPVWQLECSGAHDHGFLVCFAGAMIAVGTFIAYWVVFGLSYVNGTIQWRFPVALQIFFTLIVVTGALLLPDSPLWFMKKGYDKEACEVLTKLKNSTPDSEEVLTDFNMLKVDVEASATTQTSWKRVFTFSKTQEFQRALFGFFQQFIAFTGCNISIYYSTVLFSDSILIPYHLSLIMGGVFATVYALATIPTFFVIERVGRRKLHLIGFLGQGLSFVITFVCLIDSNPENAKGAAVGIFLHITFFAFTSLPLPWIHPPGINSLHTCTVGTVALTCTNWICNFAVVMLTPLLSGNGQWGIYLFFALFNFICLVVGYFFYVETAGREPKEIEIIYAKSHVERRLPFKVASDMPKLNFEQIAQQSRELGLGFDDHPAPEKNEFDLSSDNGQRIEEVQDKQ